MAGMPMRSATSRGAYLRIKRLAAKMSQEQLEIAATVGRSYVSRIERNTVSVGAETWEKLARTLDFPVDEFDRMSATDVEAIERRVQELVAGQATSRNTILNMRKAKSGKRPAQIHLKCSVPTDLAIWLAEEAGPEQTPQQFLVELAQAIRSQMGASNG